MVAGFCVRVPKLSRHKSGAARVRIKGKDYWCGRYGSPESLEEYRRVVASYVETGEAPRVVTSGGSLSVAEVALKFWEEHVAVYYRKHGRPTSEVANYESALKLLTSLYGTLPIAEFSPTKLRDVQKVMIQPKVTGGRAWTRNTANHHLSRIKRMVKWAVAHELAAPSVYEALRTVEGLKKGRSKARENPKKKPVPLRDLVATIRCLPPVLRDMVRFHVRTGCRPSEVCDLRPGDVTRRSKVWVYVPGSHKTEHHDRERRIPIGPKAQRILTPYLTRKPDAYCFSPREAAEQRLAEKSSRRKTPLSCGNRRGSNRVAKPTKAPGEQWDKDTYGRAVRRACKAAGVLMWSPNRLRHTYATLVRSRFGLEAAQVVLGQANAKITEVYAERDFAKAVEVAAEMG
jgi:integrase